MKICNKGFFIAGALLSCLLPLYAFDIIHANWWQWLYTVLLAAKLLYHGLSASAAERDRKAAKHYPKTAAALYGKHHTAKEYLPFIILVVYLVVGLFCRFVLDIWIPDWVHVVFIGTLTVSAFYSIGIQKAIRDHIDSIPDDAP